ncbi:centrosomal protein of 295 kDa [Conger conger]|uniref:centrosomal protein of 295 kDa n=1 Tax=Conger conger TaxID=82655 RepID=UPI002A5A8C61|nr:centrosomal protein of 295 kDa [Conger conger]
MQQEPDLEAIAQKAEEQHERAAERHREALRVLKTQKLRQQEVQTRHIQARKKAILVEKERAAKVASLPPPSPEPFEKIEAKKPPPVKISDVDNFTVTHFHMPETAVDREEDTEQPDARRVAEEEGDRLEELAKEGERERREQLAKARLRGSHALRKEHLTQDRERLLQELAHMQHADLLRRRRAVAQMPQHALQPLYSRQEVREDRQRDLEFAFEDMYTGERRIKGDLVLQLVPEPLALSSDAHDEDLDVTLEPDVLPGAEPDALDPRPPSPPAEAQAAAPEGAPPHALKKLLERIRSQRSQWSGRSADLTIESGSLASGDRTGRLPPGPPPPDQRLPSPGQETTGESVVAGTLPPDQSRAVGVRLAAEERSKRVRMSLPVCLRICETLLPSLLFYIDRGL